MKQSTSSCFDAHGHEDQMIMRMREQKQMKLRKKYRTNTMTKSQSEMVKANKCHCIKWNRWNNYENNKLPQSNYRKFIQRVKMRTIFCVARMPKVMSLNGYLLNLSECWFVEYFVCVCHNQQQQNQYQNQNQNKNTLKMHWRTQPRIEIQTKFLSFFSMGRERQNENLNQKKFTCFNIML